jgi:hypothetical protein
LANFDAAPVPQDDVVVDDIVLGKVNGRGVRVAMGEKKTVPLVLHADRDLPPWRLATQVFSSGTLQPSSTLKVTLDHTTGKAGDPVSLAIERVAPSEGLGDIVFISSANASARWYDTLYVAE